MHKPRAACFGGEAEPDGAEHQSCRHPRIGLFGKGEIGDDAAGKEHGEPEEPAILLDFKRAHGRCKRRGD
jgi:hypothetical protein